MKKRSILAAALIPVLATGCLPKESGDSVEEARNALPTSDTLKVEVPGAAQKGLEKVGDVALSYLLTRTVAFTLNGGAAVVLGVIKAITEYPVTSIEGDTYIWGPWHEALKPGEYRLTVHRTDDGDFAWALEGRQKGTADAFKALVSGTAVPGLPHRGSGSFMMDCDTARAIDPFGACEGTLAVTYDLERRPYTITMDAEKLAPTPGGGQANQTFHYAYSEDQDGAGSLLFSQFADTDDPGSAWETVQYTSRWKATGAGRTDIRASGGDLAALVTATECWSASYLRTYYADSAGWLPTEGSSTSCPF
jgi:hypothetical protein